MAEEEILGKGVGGEASQEEGTFLKHSEEEKVLEIFPPEIGIASNEQQEGRGEDKYREILAKASSNSAVIVPADEDALLDAQRIGTVLDADSKIQKVLDLAETKGVVHAVKVARTLDDYYALDQVHDALADRLYAGLLARGLIQKD